MPTESKTIGTLKKQVPLRHKATKRHRWHPGLKAPLPIGTRVIVYGGVNDEDGHEFQHVKYFIDDSYKSVLMGFIYTRNLTLENTLTNTTYPSRTEFDILQRGIYDESNAEMVQVKHHPNGEVGWTYFHNFAATDPCAICYDEITSAKRTLRCSHQYHEECIQEWLQVENKCPICRTEV